MGWKVADVSYTRTDHESRFLFGMAGLLACVLAVLLCSGPVLASDQDNAASPSAGRITGAPWQGEPGIPETVHEIMKREALMRTFGPPVQRVVPFRTIPGRPFIPQNPESPPVPGTPGHLLESPSFSVRPFTPQIIGTINFTGATLADTLAYPPDSMGAAGPTQYIVEVNGRIRSFDKTTGIADGVLDVSTDAFFASVMTPPVSSNFTTDPRIRYDRLSGKWFITMIDVPGGSASLPNRIMIAVSSGGTITGGSGFTFFQFRHDLVGTTPNADTDMFADYPTLGIDANALYIGVNVFDSSGPFSNTTAFVVRKSSVLGAGPIVVTAFRSLIGADGPFAPQGVDNYDPAAAQGYFIGVSFANFGKLILLRVNDPAATPSLSGNIPITVPTTYFPIAVPQTGTGTKLDALDDRLFAAHLRDGSLWTAHNIAVDSSGTGTPAGDRDGSRWYEIANLTGTPTLQQSGTVFDQAASNPRFYWIPTIMVSGQGHAALGFSTAGAAYHADAATVGRLAGDAPGTTGTPLLYTSSSTVYNPVDFSFPHRWGDYSYTSLDPDDDMTMWTIQEFCNARNSYGVQVVKLLAPPPATPVSASPSTVLPDQPSVDVEITGTSADGSGFFDPGAGFANHIDATINGIIVNRVTYIDPTHLSLNISTAGSAGGAYSVTVTNPDGQASTSVSAILDVFSCPVINISPASLSDATYGSPYSQAFTAEGGATPYTFGITGMLPEGIALSGDTLSGTPLQAGSFSFTVTATDSNGCTGSRGYSLTVVAATAAEIESSPGVYYTTIQSAYDHATSGDTIRVQAIDFVESPTFGNPVIVTLSGGYNSDFTDNSSYTSVMGSLTIAAGEVTIENLILH
ncbi:MAG: Ig domain-containing protein [Candidatus Sulfobium sp.]